MAEPIDVTQALKDTGNSLRDFIAIVLQEMHGDDWVEKSGVTKEQIAKWRERKQVEEKRQTGGVVEERILYYADFYSLRVILNKNWSGPFSECFGEWKTMDVWLGQLERLRDPDAHRRELMPHQKHLVLGTSGEIRTRIVRYRSKLEKPEGYFPRIECAKDSLGNIATPGSTGMMHCEQILRVGDSIDYVITASDPEGLDLEYSIETLARSNWSPSNFATITACESDIGIRFIVMLQIRSSRSYHACDSYDDMVMFVYTVLPAAH